MEFRRMRRFGQQISDEECALLLQSEKRGFLSVNGDGGYPYCIPIDFVYIPETGSIFFHGAKAGHKIDAMKSDSKVCLTICEQGVQKEDWSYHARSVVVFGHIRFIDDENEAVERVRDLAYKYYPTESEAQKEEIEEDIRKSGPRMQMFEIIPDHITGKRVHEK